MLRKHSLQQIDLSGDLQDFSFFSKVEPVSSSFYVSLGLSLFESLLRLKSCPLLTHSTWIAIFSSLSKTKSKAESWLLSEKHQEFLKIAQILNNTERKHGLKYLKTVSINSNSLIAIDYTMRFIVQLAVGTDIEFILNNQFDGFLKACENLPSILNIGIGIGRGNQLKVFINEKTESQVPMVFLYIINKGQFGILYHKACKYIDEKTEFNYSDCAVYPFITVPRKVKQKKLGNQTEVVKLIETLSQNLKKHLTLSVKKDILNRLQSVSKDLPDLVKIPAFKEMESSSKNSEFEKTVKNYSPELPVKLVLNKTNLSRNKTFSGYKKNNKKNLSFEYYNKIYKNNLELYKTCKYCKKVINCSDFSLISCNTHTICIGCRTKFYAQGMYACPECERGYSVREHNLLRVNDTSKKIGKLMPKF